MNMISIYIADDHPAVLEGLSRHLADTGKYLITGTATNGAQLINDKALHKVEVLIIDLNMPQLDGLDALEILRNNGFNGKIIINSSYITKELINDAYNKGADGYMSKTSELKNLTETIEKVFAGEKVFPIRIDVPNEDSSYYFHDDFLKKYKLTKREVEIIRLICKSKKSKEIAIDLNISEFTVSTHRKNIGFKLGIGDSIIELYKFAERNNLV